MGGYRQVELPIKPVYRKLETQEFYFPFVRAFIPLLFSFQRAKDADEKIEKISLMVPGDGL
jgi:hypothetical protein